MRDALVLFVPFYVVLVLKPPLSSCRPSSLQPWFALQNCGKLYWPYQAHWHVGEDNASLWDFKASPLLLYKVTGSAPFTLISLPITFQFISILLTPCPISLKILCPTTSNGGYYLKERRNLLALVVGLGVFFQRVIIFYFFLELPTKQDVQPQPINSLKHASRESCSWYFSPKDTAQSTIPSILYLHIKIRGVPNLGIPVC